MNWPLAHRVVRVGKTRRRLLLHLVVVGAVLMAVISGGQPAHADTTGATNPGCSEINTASFSPGCLPPLLLNLSGLYAATPTQTTGLLNLETDAVNNTIEDHGLASTDENAVLSWGRDDVEAELFALIVQAIDTSATSRDADQQDAVDWVQTVEDREAETAAQNAGLEYVKWAGLDQSTYSSLIDANADQSDLQSFLSAPPEPFGNGGSSGYCLYQPPSPDQSEYTAPTTCSANGGIGGLLGGPPTPSYDQFTEWGQVDADYSLQSSTQAVQAGADIAAGLDFGAAAVGAGVAGAVLSSGLASALVGSALQEAILPYAPLVADAEGELVGEAPAVAASEIASAAGSIAGVLIFAITTAVTEGIDVANAAALPGQLASLIASGGTNAPDPATLMGEANGAATIFSLFVGATLPMPLDQTCDNSSPIPPGVIVVSGSITEPSPVCLNPTAIPAVASTDPQFVVQEKGGTVTSTTPSITWEGTSAGPTVTARLSANWFVIQANGSDAAQTLSIPYTDWNGNEQIAWLAGNPTAGYQFVGFNVTVGTSSQLDPSTCVADGLCWSSSSINYVGSDGNDYSAQVEATPAASNTGTLSGNNPTGFPVFGNAVEGTPVEFFANTFGPLDAFNAQGEITSPMTYKWEFQQGQCNLGCLPVTGEGPAYTAPVTSNGVYDYTFPTSGTYSVRLTATDGNGDEAVDTFNVDVANVPPKPALNTAQTVPVGTPTSLAGTITHAGAQDIENVYVDWGDGSGVESGECGLPPLGPGGPECNPGWTAVPGAINQTSAGALTLTAASDTDIALTDQHTYASAGTYYATVTVTDQSGAKVSGTLVETVTNPAPTTTGLSPTSTPVGSSPTITVSGFGFVPGSTVEWDGSPLTTTYVAPPTTVSIAPRTLTAQLPATDTAGATVGTVTVVNAAPGGGTSSPQFLYVVPAQVAIAAANVATSTSATGNATASVGGTGAGKAGSLSGVASGAGTVAVAQFSADPVTTTPPTAVNAYFNVVVPTGSSFTSVQVTDCDLAGGSVVYYYDPTTTQWAEVPGQTYNASTGCVSFTLGTASTPSLSQLSSTVFGVQDVPPSLSLPGDQSVSYHAALSLSVSASDPQPNALTLSATGLPAGLAFTDNGNGTGTVTGTVTGAPGAYPVTLTASDGEVSTTSPMTITVTKAGTTLSYTGASLIATNRPATLSATLEEDGGSAPVPDGQTVTLTLGSGSGAQSCQGQTTSDGWVSCQIATVNQALGNQPVSATFAGDHYYAASSDTSQQGLVFSYLPAGGGFAVGDQAVHNATPTTTLTWWGSKWAKLNPPSGGGAPASFKGFAQTFLNGRHHRRRPGLRRDLDGDH